MSKDQHLKTKNKSSQSHTHPSPQGLVTQEGYHRIPGPRRLKIRAAVARLSGSAHTVPWCGMAGVLQGPRCCCGAVPDCWGDRPTPAPAGISQCLLWGWGTNVLKVKIQTDPMPKKMPNPPVNSMEMPDPRARQPPPIAPSSASVTPEPHLLHFLNCTPIVVPYHTHLPQMGTIQIKYV